MTARNAGNPPVTEHGNQGIVRRFDAWVVWCQCGFLEPGWPNYAVAKASLDKHNEKVAADVRS